MVVVDDIRDVDDVAVEVRDVDYVAVVDRQLKLKKKKSFQLHNSSGPIDWDEIP